MTNLEIKESVKMKQNVTNAQAQKQRKTANRGFRKPEVKGSSPFAGSIVAADRLQGCQFPLRVPALCQLVKDSKDARRCKRARAVSRIAALFSVASSILCKRSSVVFVGC
jgi:hypothetical protein